MRAVRLYELLQSEIDFINNQAAWTDEQKQVFSELLRGRFTDEGIKQNLNIPHVRYYKIKKQIYNKIERIISCKRP